MRPAEEGLLLLCCALGTQDVPLTPAQYRTLARRVRQTCQAGDGEVTPAYLRALGYPEAAALQITALLDRTDTLYRYLETAAAQGIPDGLPGRIGHGDRLNERLPGRGGRQIEAPAALRRMHGHERKQQRCAQQQGKKSNGLHKHCLLQT